MNLRAVLVCHVLLATMWLAGCGHYVCHETFGSSTCSSSNNGGKGTNTSGTYLLIADAGGIQGLVLDASTGTINVTPNFGNISVPTNVPGDWMAVAQQKYMYSAYTALGKIYGWGVNSDGTLVAITGSPFDAAYVSNTTGGSQVMITNPAGTLLFVLDSLNEQVNVYQIGTGGGLTVASGSPLALPTGFTPYNMATDGQGKYLYISNTNGGGVASEVAAYSIGSAGTLTPAGNPFASTLVLMQGESSGKYMIGIASPLSNPDSHLHVLTIGSTGALTDSPSATVNVPSRIAVQPSSGGNLIYSFSLPTGTSDSVIEGYQLNLSTGALTAITGSPFTATGVYGEFDQNGKYFFVVQSTNSLSAEMDAFSVGTAPALATPVATLGWAKGAWQPFDTP